MAEKVYITGDCHQDFEKFNAANFPEQRNLDKDDNINNYTPASVNELIRNNKAFQEQEACGTVFGRDSIG